MRYQRTFATSIAALLLFTSFGVGQCKDPVFNPDPIATVVDGAITLTGSVSGLAGIQASSEGGYLSLDVIELGGDDLLYLTEPFSIEAGAVVQNDPNRIVIGVLGSDNRVDLEGVTRTSILYSESQAVADVDLDVLLGTGGISPHENPINGCATILNGEVTLHGSFGAPDSLSLESSGGFLSIESLDGGLTVSGPFSEIGGNSSTRIQLRAAGIVGLLQGENIETGVFYSAPGSTAASGDLQITLGFPFGSDAVVRVVPEPANSWMACLAGLVLMRWRSGVACSRN